MRYPRLDHTLHDMLDQLRSDSELSLGEVALRANRTKWLKNMPKQKIRPTWIKDWEDPKDGKCFLGFERRWKALCEVYGVQMIDIVDAAGLLDKSQYEFIGVDGIGVRPLTRRTKRRKKK